MWSPAGTFTAGDGVRTVVSVGDQLAAYVVDGSMPAIARSVNLGASWEVASIPPLLAWAADATRMWGVFSSSGRHALHRSDDGGRVWHAVGELPLLEFGQVALGASADRLFAIYTYSTGLSSAVSNDGGLTWTY